jgi:hypothetical protein
MLTAAQNKAVEEEGDASIAHEEGDASIAHEEGDASLASQTTVAPNIVKERLEKAKLDKEREKAVKLSAAQAEHDKAAKATVNFLVSPQSFMQMGYCTYRRAPRRTCHARCYKTPWASRRRRRSTRTSANGRAVRWRRKTS